MSEQVAPRGTFGFERKVNIPTPEGVYGTESITASHYVQYDIDPSNPELTAAAARQAAFEAKALVYDELGLDVHLDVESGFAVIREGAEAASNVVDFAAARANVEAAFGPVTAEPQEQAVPPSGAAWPEPQAAAGRQFGKVVKPMGELPSWIDREFNYQLGKGNVEAGEDLWDNRPRLPQFGGNGSPKQPWFKGTKSGGGLWAPPER